MTASSSLPRPTVRTCSTRHCCVPAVSTVRSWLALPDIRGREQILKAHAQSANGRRRRSGVIARGTPGFSGADLANLVNGLRCSLPVPASALSK